MTSDLLPHKYRPGTVDKFRCHPEQANRLKQWIQEFMDASCKNKAQEQSSDFDDSYSDSNASDTNIVLNKCILLTGPPGIGKTSLVYTVAKELNLHVIESHSAEKRDFKLFNTLRLANQKGKINPIAKLFQVAAQQQAQLKNSKRKRRKLSETTNGINQPEHLSLSGDASIVLFDDIDVIFEEDGPFLKSLVEFIRDSKRPVVLTATQSIDHIKNSLNFFEHIQLNRPMIEDLTQILCNVCTLENYKRISKTKYCSTIASIYECDIRKCLNNLHFYGNKTVDILLKDFKYSNFMPKFSNLSIRDGSHESDDTDSVLKCYHSSTILDLIDTKFNLTDRSAQLQQWLDGKPASRDDDYNFNYMLTEQIRDSIADLCKNLYSNEMITIEDSIEQRKDFETSRQEALEMSHTINSKIKGRIEPPEKEFFTDIVPMLGETIRFEAERRTLNPFNGGLVSRRSRRMQSYLESIAVYLEPTDIAMVSRTLLRSDEDSRESLDQ